MDKKLKIFVAAMACANVAFAQDVVEEQSSFVLDNKEEMTDVVTIKDIVKMQQQVTSRNVDDSHFTEVWRRKSFFNISFNIASLTPTGFNEGDTNLNYVPTTSDSKKDGFYNKGKAPEYKSNWGITLQNGSNYRLHKKPLANTVLINLDYSWIDLSVNHFSKESTDLTAIDNEVTSDNLYYLPWNAEKYELNYGMSLGPSVTVAPFNFINSRPLHFFKINAFFHVGYNVSLLMMNNSVEKSSTRNNNDGLKLTLGHGIYTAFGVSLSWKGIGVGFESRSNAYKYKAIVTGDYGSGENNFDASATRVYLQYRF